MGHTYSPCVIHIGPPTPYLKKPIIWIRILFLITMKSNVGTKKNDTKMDNSGNPKVNPTHQIKSKLCP